MSTTVTREEVDAIVAEVDRLRDEFVSEDAELGTGAMSAEEHERLSDRVDRMLPEHRLALFLMLSDMVHGRLSGSTHDAMTMMKTCFTGFCACLTNAEGFVEMFAAGWAIYEGEEEFDIAYLDEGGVSSRAWLPTAQREQSRDDARRHLERLIGRLEPQELKYVFRGPLTRGQFDALLGAAIGETSKETGERLFKSWETIRTQRCAALRRLGAASCREAIQIAFWTGLIDIDSILDAIGRQPLSLSYQSSTRGRNRSSLG